MSLRIGIISTCEIPVVGRNYCVFLSFLDVLPVKETNMLIESKGHNIASRCLAAKIPQPGFGSNHYLLETCIGAWTCLPPLSTDSKARTVQNQVRH